MIASIRHQFKIDLDHVTQAIAQQLPELLTLPTELQASA
jgi:hypothetical protein